MCIEAFKGKDGLGYRQAALGYQLFKTVTVLPQNMAWMLTVQQESLAYLANHP